MIHENNNTHKITLNQTLDLIDGFTYAFFQTSEFDYKKEVYKSIVINYTITSRIWVDPGFIRIRKINENLSEVICGYKPIDYHKEHDANIFSFLNKINIEPPAIDYDEFLFKHMELIPYLDVDIPEEYQDDDNEGFDISINYFDDDGKAGLDYLRKTNNNIRKLIQECIPYKHLNIYERFPDFPDITDGSIQNLESGSLPGYAIFTEMALKAEEYITPLRIKIIESLFNKYIEELTEDYFPIDKQDFENPQQRRMGGPLGHSPAEKRKILDEWDRVQGKEIQEHFCNRHYISVSTLGKWKRELQKYD